MPDLGALLWPRTVALVGASADAESLRGRIFNVMRGHAFAGQLYPVSRSSAEVLGMKAYASVADLPQPADLAVIIIPAKHVAEELERCGKAGVRSAVVLSSGFAEAIGDAGGKMQDEVRAVAKRYDMAVMGPNSEGFANIAANLCPTFSPAMEAGGRPLVPAGRPRPQIAVAAQSGGMGFAFFDHGRAKELSFRYVVTTGNEACLEALDFAEFILDEGKTDALMLLLEDIKTADTFRRVAEKALKAGKPIIVNKIGQSDAGVRAAASHTAALAGTYAAYQAMFQRYGIIEGRDIGEMVDIAAGFVAWGRGCPRTPGRHLHGLRRRRRLDGGCLHGGGPGGSRARCRDAPAHRQAPAGLRHVAEPGRRHGAGGVQDRLRRLAELVLPSPVIDGVIHVMSARLRTAGTRARGPGTSSPRRQKPILAWSYTLPAQKSVQALSEAGLPLFTDIGNCARTMRVMADYRALRERFLRPIEATARPRPTRPRRALPGRRRAGAVRVGGPADPRRLRHRRRPRRHAGGFGGGGSCRRARHRRPRRAQGAIAGNPAQDGSRRSRAELALPRRCARRLRQGARQCPAPCASGAGPRRSGAADGAPGREIILGVKRDATFGPLLMVGLGGVAVEVLKDVALAPVPLEPRRGARHACPAEGAALLEAHRGAPAADVDALVDLMVRLSRFAADHADTVAEVDLNPVLVHARGNSVSVVDALIVKR